MEVLNQNQRRSAIWRLLALGMVVLALLAVSVSSIHKAYANAGQGDLELLRKECQEELQRLRAQKQDLQNKNKVLNKEIEDLKEQMKNPDDQVQILQARLQQREDRIKDLETDLTRVERSLESCENRLRAATTGG